MIYKCIKCNKTFTDSPGLNYHINNSVCTKKDVECIGCNKTYKNKTWLDKHIVKCKLYHNYLMAVSLLSHNYSNTIPNTTPKLSKNDCEYCGKSFIHKANMYRHKKKSCKVKKDQIEIKKQINEKQINQTQINQTQINETQIDKLAFTYNEVHALKQELKEQKELIKILLQKEGSTNVYTHIGNTTQQNNIQINGFGKEDISYLTDSNKVNICGTIYGSVVKCIEAIHLNDKHPENKNIRMRSHKRGEIEKFDHNKQKWQISDLNEGVKELIDINYDRVLDFYNETAKSKMTSKKNERFENFIKDMDDELPDLINKIEKNTKNLIKNSIK